MRNKQPAIEIWESQIREQLGAGEGVGAGFMQAGLPGDEAAPRGPIHGASGQQRLLEVERLGAHVEHEEEGPAGREHAHHLPRRLPARLRGRGIEVTRASERERGEHADGQSRPTTARGWQSQAHAEAAAAKRLVPVPEAFLQADAREDGQREQEADLAEPAANESRTFSMSPNQEGQGVG